MPQTIPEDAAEERLRWIRPYLDGRCRLKDIAELSPFGYRTLKRWVGSYRMYGVAGLQLQSRRPHSSPNETPRNVIDLIVQLRNIVPRFGARKIAIRLKKRRTITIDWRTVHKILKQKGLVKKRRRVPPKPRIITHVTIPGEMVEIDVRYTRQPSGVWHYQFTAIDAFSRWQYAEIFKEQTTQSALVFLEHLIEEASFRIRGIKTDNHTIFTNRYVGYPKSTDPLNPRLHAFDVRCQRHSIVHYLIPPGKPQMNGKVERAHRSIKEELWETPVPRTNKTLRRYLEWYNREREHLGIEGLTPQEKLESFTP